MTSRLRSALLILIWLSCLACSGLDVSTEKLTSPPTTTLTTTTTTTPGLTVSDHFDGDGPLLGYETLLGATDDGGGLDTDNITPIGRAAGRYQAVLVNNAGEATLHFNGLRGRLDAKRVRFPFVYIARNIGIGTVANSQLAPSAAGSPYIFAGVQVKNISNNDSAHIVIGHRGGTGFTIEGKNTIFPSSSVDDDGANALPLGRGDIRVEGTAAKQLRIQWQAPNLSGDPGLDAWIDYRGSRLLPSPAPTFEDEVLIGLITYAQGTTGVPFVGTCDSVELVGE